MEQPAGKACGHHPDLLCGCGLFEDTSDPAAAMKAILDTPAQPATVAKPESWMVCEVCGAGPFLEHHNRFMHWYDSAHLTYRIVDPPEDGLERSWDVMQYPHIMAALARREEQRRFDMAEPL